MHQLSQYNYFTEYEEKVIYSNGISGALFAMTKNEHEKIQVLFDDLISFQIQYNSVFEKFKEWGFIVDSDMNEVDIIRLRNKRAVFEEKNYRLIINPTLDCVFNCWYCSQHTQNAGGMSEEIKNRITKHLDYMIRGGRITGLFLDWFGGEPLMYFDEVMYPISLHALDLLQEFNMPLTNHATTNAYLINEDMVKKMAEIKLNSFQITLDGDEKRHDKIRNVNGKPSFRKIMENIQLILEHIPDSRITLRLNYDNKTLGNSDMISVYEQIPEQYRKRVSVSLVRVWQTVKDNPEANQELNVLINSLTKMGFSNATSASFEFGRSIVCYTDRFYQTVINYDGKIYRCTARTLQEEGVLHENGVVEWNEKRLSKHYGKARFENDRCLACKYLPICLNKCVMATDDKCILDQVEITPEQFIINSYQQKVTHNK